MLPRLGLFRWFAGVVHAIPPLLFQNEAVRLLEALTKLLLLLLLWSPHYKKKRKSPHENFLHIPRISSRHAGVPALLLPVDTPTTYLYPHSGRRYPHVSIATGRGTSADAPSLGEAAPSPHPPAPPTGIRPLSLASSCFDLGGTAAETGTGTGPENDPPAGDLFAAAAGVSGMVSGLPGASAADAAAIVVLASAAAGASLLLLVASRWSRATRSKALHILAALFSRHACIFFFLWWHGFPVQPLVSAS